MNDASPFDQNEQLALQNELKSEFATPPPDGLIDLHLETLSLEAARLRRKQRSRSGRTGALVAIVAVALTALVIVDQREPTFTATDSGPASGGVTSFEQPSSDSNAVSEDPSDREDLEFSRSTFNPDADVTATTADEAGQTTPTSGAPPRSSTTPQGPSTSTPTTGSQASNSSRNTTTTERVATSRPTTTERTTTRPATTDRPSTIRQSTTTRPTTQPTTTPSTASTTTVTTTVTTTTQPPATTISIPGPDGPPFQLKFVDATLISSLCMLNSGYSMIGIPGQSDHPLTSDPSYIAAFDLCDITAGLRAVVAEHVVWELQLNSAQKSVVNDAMTPVFSCARDKGWDFGQLQLNPRGLLWFTQFPPTTRTQIVSGEYLHDLTNCGLYDIPLG